MTTLPMQNGCPTRPSVAGAGLSDRQHVEQDFHDRWADLIDVDGLLVRESFEAATAVENRYALERLQPVAGRRLLDLGCGAGETSVYLASQGARVVATDISRRMLQVTRALALKHGQQVVTQQAVAERLPFADESFDLVFGNGVLHHVEIRGALREIHRVLRPGGRAAFIEPLPYNPVIEVYRRLADANRTPTERPFRFTELDYARTLFRSVDHREFWLVSLYIFLHFFFVERVSPSKVRYWKKVIEDAPKYERLVTRLYRWDERLLRWAPPLGRLCWNTVVCVQK